MHRKVGDPFWVQLKGLDAPALTPEKLPDGQEPAKVLVYVKDMFNDIAVQANQILAEIKNQEATGDVNLKHALKQVITTADQIIEGIQTTCMQA